MINSVFHFLEFLSCSLLVLGIVIVIDPLPLRRLLQRPQPVPSSRRRGTSMLFMLGLTVILAVWCSLILDRSFEATRAGAMMTWRLQARAAAEGVAVILQNDPAHPPTPQTLGSATVTCGLLGPHVASRASGTPSPDEHEVLVPIDVTIRPPGSNVVRLAMHYQARCIQTGNRWQLLRLEE